MGTPSTLRKLLEGPLGSVLERDTLPRWLPERRWFRSKARAIASTGFEALVSPEGSDAVFSVVRVEFSDGGTERYQLPLALVTRQEATKLPAAARLIDFPDADDRVLIDGSWNGEFQAGLYDLLFSAQPMKQDFSDSKGDSVGILRGLPASSGSVPPPPARVLSAEQSNTSLVYGSGSQAVFVKLYRKLEPGIHPEPEMLRFLREETAYRRVPEFLSSLEWTPAAGIPSTVALAQEFLPDGVNAWEHFLGRLRAGRGGVPDDLLALAGRMGRRVGELHRALGSRPDLPAFAPESLTGAEWAAVRRGALDLLEHALAFLESGKASLPPETAALARAVLAQAATLRASLRGTGDPASAGRKIRTHGDLHLGQMLVEGDDLRILDFEGEPGRPLEAARAKHAPLRDVAGMLRSFHYAAHAAETEGENGPAAERGFADQRAAHLGRAFLAEYENAMAGSGLLPDRPADRREILDVLLLEKAVYELQYEWNNRPDWAAIPLRGLIALAHSNRDG